MEQIDSSCRQTDRRQNDWILLANMPNSLSLFNSQFRVCFNPLTMSNIYNNIYTPYLSFNPVAIKR